MLYERHGKMTEAVDRHPSWHAMRDCGVGNVVTIIPVRPFPSIILRNRQQYSSMRDGFEGLRAYIRGASRKSIP